MELNVAKIFSDSFWVIGGALVTLTTTITGVINQKFKVKKEIKKAVSWVISTLLSIGAWALGFVSFDEPSWVGVATLCVVIGLSSNGFYSIKQIETFVKSWFPDKVTAQKS